MQSRLAFTVAAVGLSLPAMAQYTAYAVTSANQRVIFNNLTPGSAGAPVALSGLNAGENIVGLDQRYSFPSFPISLVSDQSRIFSVNGSSANLTVQGAVPFDPPLDLTAASYGVDINPTVDRIRVVDANGGNRRLHPNGTAVATDTSLTYNDGSGLIPRAVGAAYTNPLFFGGPPAPGTVRQFIVDSSRDILGEVGSLAGGNPSFNAGVVTPVGPLGIDLGDQVGFDIIPGVENLAYLSNVVGNETFLYSVNLQTGAATLVGEIGNNLVITDFTFVIPAPSAAALLGLGALAAVRRRR